MEQGAIILFGSIKSDRTCNTLVLAFSPIPAGGLEESAVTSSNYSVSKSRTEEVGFRWRIIDMKVSNDKCT